MIWFRGIASLVTLTTFFFECFLITFALALMGKHRMAYLADWHLFLTMTSALFTLLLIALTWLFNGDLLKGEAIHHKAITAPLKTVLKGIFPISSALIWMPLFFFAVFFQPQGGKPS